MAGESVILCILLQLGGTAGTGHDTANKVGNQARDVGNKAGQQAQRAGDQAGQTARNAQGQAGQAAQNVRAQAGQAAQGIQQQAHQVLDAAQPYIEQAKQVASEYTLVAADKARELSSIAQAQGGDTLRSAACTQNLLTRLAGKAAFLCVCVCVSSCLTCVSLDRLAASQCTAVISLMCWNEHFDFYLTVLFRLQACTGQAV